MPMKSTIFTKDQKDSVRTVLSATLKVESGAFAVRKINRFKAKTQNHTLDAPVYRTDASSNVGGQLMENFSALSLSFANSSMTSSRYPLVGG